MFKQLEDRMVQGGTSLISSEEGESKLKEFFTQRIKEIAASKKAENKGTPPTVTEIVDELSKCTVDNFRDWLVKKGLSYYDAQRYADAARRLEEGNKTPFNRILHSIIKKFYENPGEFSNYYSEDNLASDPTIEPKQVSISNTSPLPVYVDLQREYRSDWIADPVVIIKQAAITFALGVVDLAKKRGNTDKEIKKFLGFLPNDCVDLVLELDKDRANTEVLNTLRNKLDGWARSILKGEGFDESNYITSTSGILNIKELKDLLRENSLFKEGESISVPDSNSRLSGAGAKVTAVLNYLLALQCANIGQVLLEHIFTEAENNQVWGGALKDLLSSTGSKVFPAGSASNEPPVDQGLYEQGWYANMVKTLSKFDTNRYIFKRNQNKKGGKTKGSEATSLYLDKYIADPVVYLFLFTPETINDMAKKIREEDEKRGQTGTFHDKTNELFNILQYNKSEDKYTLPPEKRVDFYNWIKGRKSDPNKENPNHPATWFLNQKTIRFTGIGSDIPTKIRVDVAQPKEYFGAGSDVIINYNLSQVFVGKKTGEQNMGEEGGEQNLQPPAEGIPLKTSTALYSPNGEFIAISEEKGSGIVVHPDTGTIEISSDLLSNHPSSEQTFSVVRCDRESKIGKEGAGDIDYYFDYNIGGQTHNHYILYLQVVASDEKSRFYAAAGTNLSRSGITNEMQRANAGTSFVYSTQNDYTLRVEKKNFFVKWDRLYFSSNYHDINSSSFSRNSNAITIESEDGVQVFADGIPLKKPKVIVLNDEKEGKHSEGIFVVEVNTPPPSPWRKFVDRDPEGNYILTDFIPAAHMPIGVVGLGYYYDNTKKRYQFELVLNGQNNGIVLKEEPIAQKNSKLIYTGHDGVSHTVAYVSYSEDGKPNENSVFFDPAFMRGLMEGKISGPTGYSGSLDKLVVQRTKLDGDGMISNAIKFNYSNSVVYCAALDPIEWNKTDTQIQSIVSYLANWDLVVLDTEKYKKAIKEGKSDEKAVQVAELSATKKTVHLYVREEEGSTPEKPRLILSYKVEKGENEGKLLDVFRAYRENGVWYCEPLKESKDPNTNELKPNFDKNGAPINVFKLFLQEIEVLPSLDEDKGTGLWDDGLDAYVPRKLFG